MYNIFFSFSCFPIQLGSTAIGIQTNEGVVLAVEKRVTSPLIEPTSIEKIMEVDKHIGENVFLMWYILLISCSVFDTEEYQDTD